MKHLLVPIFGLFLATCNTTDPPQYVRSIELSAEDASCTEAWLRVRITDGSSPPFDIRLHRDGDSVQTLRLSTPDSVVIDEGLLPNRQYTYKAYRLTDSTTLQTVTTMDTTSSNWVFDPPLLLGDGSSSVLYDVAIINDTLAYAVGEIYYSDSSQSFLPFSVASWNGQTWQLKRLYYNGTNIITAIRGIWVAGPNDIWLAAGSVFHWDGTSSQAQLSFSRLSLPDPSATIEKLWGSPELGLYGVGNAGTIVHRNTSGTWRRMESGTDLHVYDVFGAQNPETETLEVYAAAAQQFVSFEKRILQLTPAGVSAMPDSNIPHSIHGIWFDPGKRYYVVGSGMYAKYAITIPAPWRWLHLGVTQYYLYAISGTKLNNITACGAFGEILHFSGATWRSYRDRTAIDSGAYYGVSMKENLIIAVGFESSHAVVAIGRR